MFANLSPHYHQNLPPKAPRNPLHMLGSTYTGALQNPLYSKVQKLRQTTSFRKMRVKANEESPSPGVDGSTGEGIKMEIKLHCLLSLSPCYRIFAEAWGLVVCRGMDFSNVHRARTGLGIMYLQEPPQNRVGADWRISDPLYMYCTVKQLTAHLFVCSLNKKVRRAGEFVETHLKLVRLLFGVCSLDEGNLSSCAPFSEI